MAASATATLDTNQRGRSEYKTSNPNLVVHEIPATTGASLPYGGISMKLHGKAGRKTEAIGIRLGKRLDVANVDICLANNRLDIAFRRCGRYGEDPNVRDMTNTAEAMI